MGCSILLAFGPAQAGVSTFGSSLARDCFEKAQTGAKDTGLEDCGKALAQDQLSGRDRAATLVNRGIIYNRTRQLDLALADFDAALQLNQELGEAHLNRGNTHFFRREFEAAAADYTKAIELKCSDIQVAYYNRALVALVTGRFDDATGDLNSALAVKPDFKDATQQLLEVEKRRAAAAQAPQAPAPQPPAAPDAQPPAAPPGAH
jgi:tetratricopeptide (TPR) repeat protein